MYQPKLSFKRVGDEDIECAVREHVFHGNALGLTHAICAILRLKVGRNPIEILKDYMGCKAVDRFQTDPEVRVAICNIIAGGVGITLTAAVNALRSQVQTTPSNACTKNRLVLVEAVGKGREQHQLAVGRNHIPYTLFHSPVLGLAESHADLGELSKEVLVVGLRSVRCGKPLGERPLRLYGRCIFHRERNPAADFRQQIEDVILLSTKRHLFHKEV